MSVGALGLVECVEGPTAPGGERSTLAFAPVWDSRASRSTALLDEAGLPLDRVRIIVIRPVSDTLKDTTVTIHRGDPQIDLGLNVAARPGEELQAHLQFKSGSTVLFEGSASVTTVAVTAPIVGTTPIPMVFVGPGATATSVQVSPGSGSFSTSAPITFTATARDLNGIVLSGTAFDWAVNDATLGAISGSGVFTPSGKRGNVVVTASTFAPISGSATVSLLPPAASIAVVSGNNQSGPQNTTLGSPVIVVVKAADGVASPGETVTFAALDGGTVTPASVVTNANGQAQATLKIGTRIGTYGFTATSGSFSVPIAATGTASGPAGIAIVSGSAQSDTVLKTLANPLVVKVTDAAGDPVSGATVTWTRLTGAGTTSGPTSITNASGLASMSYTLGLTAGSESIQASVTGVASTVTFTATAIQRVATAIALVSGNAQTDTVTKSLANPFVVKVTFSNGDPVNGATVTWTRLSGGGSPATTTSTTNAAGLATLTYTLGTTPGAESVRASVAGIVATQTFSATAVAGAPAEVAIVSGNAQIDTIHKTLANPFVVKVSDAHGNVVSGATVSWTRIGGFGSPANTTTTTNALGLASLTYTLGDIGGADTVRASVTGVGGTVTFIVGVRDGLGTPIVTGFAYLSVLPSPVTVRVGDTLTFTADSISATGQASRVTAVWASGNPGRGAIDATGRMIVADTGQIIVTATRNGMIGHARVVVLPAPLLTGFSFSPKTLNGIANSPLTLSLSFTIVDKGANGVTSGVVTITGPTGVTRTCTATAPTSGNARSGTFDCAITLPAGSAAGAWHVTSLVLNGSISRTFAESVLATFGTTTLTVNP